MNPTELTLFLSIFVALMAPVLDFKFKKVPTWLTIPALAAGASIAFAVGGWKPAGLGYLSLLGSDATPCLFQVTVSLALVLVIYTPMTLKGGFAREDLWLLLAIASLNSTHAFIRIFFVASIIGFLMALVLLLKKGMLGEGFKAILRLLAFRPRQRDDQGKLAPIHKLTIPYSPAVALGVIGHFVMSQGLLS